MITKLSTLDMSHEEWLMQRRKGIGGSDAGALLGLNPYRGAYDVYADKIGMAPPVEDNEAMRQGRDLEAYVAERFEQETGKRVRRRNAIITNSEYPFALANIDREIVGEHAGLECKTTSVLNLTRYKNGEFPSEYYCQCMHYLMVTGWDKWYLAVLVYGTDFKIFEIERDEDEIAALVRSLIAQTDALAAVTAGIGDYCDPATATYCRDALLPAMRQLRHTADCLEEKVDARFWPIPTYDEILFDEQG